VTDPFQPGKAGSWIKNETGAGDLPAPVSF
jgi:hypothetical protein